MTKDQLIVPDPQPIAAALWRMQDSRERTLNVVKDFPEAALEWQGAGLQNSISTLLYHIAIIEMDWLFEEVLQTEWAAEILVLFPYPVRDKDGQLHKIQGVNLTEHLDRLETTRHYFVNCLKSMSLEDFYRLRQLPNYDVSPEWVLHHLAQHEDEHRGEITTIRTLYAAHTVA